MKRKNIYVFLIIAVLFPSFLILRKWQNQNIDINLNGLNQSKNHIIYNNKIYKISTTTDNQLMYKNELLGLSFIFPIDWHIGHNELKTEGGYLQLFNYDQTKSNEKSIFPVGHNKIEIVILKNNYPNEESLSDYPEKTRIKEKLNISDQEVVRTKIELVSGQKFVSYSIPIPNGNESIAHITIYGDQNNFDVLDDLVKSIKWNK